MPHRLTAAVRAHLFEQLVDTLPFAVSLWTLPPGADARPDALLLLAHNRLSGELSHDHQRPGMTLGELLPRAVVERLGPPLVAAIVDRRVGGPWPMVWPRHDGSMMRFYSWAVPLPGEVAALVGVALPDGAPADPPLWLGSGPPVEGSRADPGAGAAYGVLPSK
jgi:hypothetical protein